MYQISDLLLNQGDKQSFLEEFSLQNYRFNQIEQCVFRKKILDIDKMSNLSIELREKLMNNLQLCTMKIVKEIKEAKTDTTKLLLETHDNYAIEIVILNDENRHTLCISSQIGCPIGCGFCATGQLKFIRNLSTQEIIDQLLLSEQFIGKNIDNLVFMGMGEPMLNYKNVENAIEILIEKSSRKISSRRITISTIGINGFADKLIHLKLQIKLSISLHSPLDYIRKQIMPKALPINELVSECIKYKENTGRRITFEYILIGGITDTNEQIGELMKLAKKLNAFINLIEYNTIDGINYRYSSKSNEIKNKLIFEGLEVSIRYRRGRDIKAACGQLVWENLQAK